MRVRVLRVIEYDYESLDTYNEDKARWTTNINNKRQKMDSAVVSITTIDGEPVAND